MNHLNRMLLVASIACGLASPVCAQETSHKPDALVVSAGYLSYHPDARERLEGFQAMKAGLSDAAFSAFKRAAHYADKPSQAMLAYMLWNGIGVERNRPLAYAWMDLAAERYYPQFLIEREKYWAALTAAERKRAIEVGQPILAEFGDDAAKPRLARQLRRGARQRTGSRTGGPSGPVRIIVAGGGDILGNVNNGNPSSATTIDAADYYQDRYWKPKAYWAWQDEIWGKPRTGTVDVGPATKATREDPVP